MCQWLCHQVTIADPPTLLSDIAQEPYMVEAALPHFPPPIKEPKIHPNLNNCYKNFHKESAATKHYTVYKLSKFYKNLKLYKWRESGKEISINKKNKHGTSSAPTRFGSQLTTYTVHYMKR